MTLVVSLLAILGGDFDAQAQKPELIPHYRNLAVYAIFDPLGAFRDSEYITLDEGLKAGTVTVSEKGAQPVIRRDLPRTPNPPQPIRQEYEQGAEVNTLWLTNLSGRKLILLSGEMVRGGQQDRIIGKDTIIPPSKQPVDLGVFCVEHGRWNGVSKFEAANAAIAMAAPQVRAPAQVNQDQQAVWNGVARARGVAKIEGGSGAYRALAEDKSVQGSVEEYVRNIEKAFPTGAVGVAVAVNGKMVWVDRFSTASLFQKYWPKLLHSYAVEALTNQERTKFPIPSWKEANAFAEDRSGKTSYEVNESKAKLIKTESARHTIFRLQDLSAKPVADVHESKVAKAPVIGLKIR